MRGRKRENELGLDGERFDFTLRLRYTLQNLENENECSFDA